jgi:hypothetical protein
MEHSLEASFTKPVTKQTKRDRVEWDRRMNNSAAHYTEMASRLKPYPKKALLDAAESMYQTRGIPRPDRICFRSRIPLICHYCEHFPDFPLGFCSLLLAVEIQRPVRNRAIHVDIEKQDPPREAAHDLIGLFAPHAFDSEAIDGFTLLDEDPGDSWFATD